jgi:peptidoglycan hydrolase-like amidase
LPDSHSARFAPTSAGRTSRDSSTFRAILGAVLVLSALAAPGLANPEPVAAGSSCTGWTSITTPPRSIRVLNSRTGAVDKVPFRRYVKQVMASGEWPSHLKMATLEAGAIVTKQFAWYHRRSTRPGAYRCASMASSS